MDESIMKASNDTMDSKLMSVKCNHPSHYTEESRSNFDVATSQQCALYALWWCTFAVYGVENAYCEVAGCLLPYGSYGASL